MSFREEMLKKMRTAEALPALPAIIGKLSRMVNKGDASAEEIARLLQLDPAMASRLLRVANSAALGGTVRVASIPQAVIRIGIRGVRDLVLTFVVMRLFKPSGRLDHHQLWRHSLSVAYAAQIVERLAAGIERPADETFTAGLLHDIGILLLDKLAGEVYARVVEYALVESKDLYDAEQAVLGITHAEIGALLLEQWNVPALVTEVARYHHQPYPPIRATSLLVKCVHLANFACNNHGINSGLGPFFNQAATGAWYDTGLSVEQIPKLIEEMQALVDTADELIRIAGA